MTSFMIDPFVLKEEERSFFSESFIFGLRRSLNEEEEVGSLGVLLTRLQYTRQQSPPWWRAQSFLPYFERGGGFILNTQLLPSYRSQFHQSQESCSKNFCTKKAARKMLVKLTPRRQFYRVCHRFRLRKQDDYFRVTFDHFWGRCHFLWQLGQ